MSFGKRFSLEIDEQLKPVNFDNFILLHHGMFYQDSLMHLDAVGIGKPVYWWCDYHIFFMTAVDVRTPVAVTSFRCGWRTSWTITS